jgi:proteic killer suppression protein
MGRLHASRATDKDLVNVISSFADRTTEDIFHGSDAKAARAIPRAIWSVARRKLDALGAAHDVGDLRAPPGNRLEKLRGSLDGRWSIRINDQFRVVFRYESGSAHDVQITDDH